MPLAAPADYIQVPGKVDILFAVPGAYLNLFKLGESEDGIEVRKIPMVGGVKGDRYGGNSGGDIENQFFGLEAEFQLQMSRWDPVQLLKLETFGGLLSTPGAVPIQSIGALIQRDRSYRFLLYCYRDPTLSLNFPCCQWSTPQTQGRSTKYSRCGMQIRAKRAPEGYWQSAAVGVVYNSDTTGIPDPYTFS
jgi:hypothetical protein